MLPNGDIMPAGLEFVIDFGVMMRDPATFEKPLEFNPARFLTDKGLEYRKGNLVNLTTNVL